MDPIRDGFRSFVDGGSSFHSDAEYAEMDPTGRYIRYEEILGKGAFKTVYKAFDEIDGIEVAWNQVRIDEVLQSPENLERLYSEVHLLKSLTHENIIKFYNSWVDDQNKTINIITELFTSGSLRQYCMKHKRVDMRAVKNWAKQILRGLEYLHSHDPSILHRDLKCDNIFVNGNHGEIKIGDLGFATMMQQPTAHSVIGTPEFMAPELYEEDYNELADIYSFGMCMLEMITFEYPYSECKNAAQIYKKVISGIKPAAFAKVTDPQVKIFIEKCLVPASERMTARELLKDSFLQYGNELGHDSNHSSNIVPRVLNILETETLSMEVDIDSKPNLNASTENSRATYLIQPLVLERTNGNNAFRISWEEISDKVCDNSIYLVLRMVDSLGHLKNVHFQFFLDSDSAIDVAREMREQLALADSDLIFVADLIDCFIMKLIPGWEPSTSYPSSGIFTPCEEYGKYPVSPGCSWNSLQSNPAKTLNEQNIISQLNHDCSRADRMDESGLHADFISISSPSNGDEKYSQCSDMSLLMDESYKSFSEYVTDVDSGIVDHYGYKMEGNSTNLASLPSYVSSFSCLEKDQDGLKAELEMIDAQFKCQFNDLFRKREATSESARKRWFLNKRDD